MFQFSLSRWWSMVTKEFLQIRRDRVTLGMIAVLPIVQLTLFGFAINNDPKHLRTIALSQDRSEFSRSLVAGLRNTGYFDMQEGNYSEAEAAEALKRGTAQFVISVPSDFSNKLIRDQKPAILVEADATDPAATGNAIAALNTLIQSVFKKDMGGPLSHLSPKSSFEAKIHKLYNPSGIAQYNIIPGLMGVILSMTMVMMTSLAITRERERGTIENILSSPALPIEVICGKIVPYVIVGLLQCTVILLAARFLFEIPFRGNLLTVYCLALLLILANLMVGISISSIAANQLQAMQMTFFYFLPSVLLSGFMFPFMGMPRWAQMIGNCLPLTYFNRAIRGVLLKGNGWIDMWPNAITLVFFGLLMMTIGVLSYKKTLD
ncbi:mannose-1-phosphate guanyltransferase [Burkholderia ubonensis]|uniref:ABC transporter permease n=1 Tax=Burkholderia ubonensis TaxID=101571 RepID=UPI00075E2B7E|nr:ABC transporter permease [Burkholderia ubonensis]KVO74355.1 mannose-1-phosphate guanyltransferase [Burkholderia ubonensis]KVR15255.1 mannose-1-phosphate guanyltransferase [Burkholderia ubonensis]KVR30647.1 mannose-1-phosphate guanyltransferase [Burkholderia ubonensis]KWD12431.1 mannose-1-phosphate guanyltransferase [Burkholderia ubonensis]KWD18943.1 mannose-1-phosphate guanyltransferase [Burkholderia ubonensis]